MRPEPVEGPDLLRRVAAWTEQDPDPETRRRLDDLVTASGTGDEAATAELTDAFTGRLEFGTAGLRGALGPGPNRMNRVVVGQAAAGWRPTCWTAAWPAGAYWSGYDARHNSDRFAKDTAEIMAGAGFATMITAGPLPTPVIAFGIRHLGCVAAVVVTASHNPPQDNGYKVYLGDGSQIVPPADAEIAARIDEVAERRLDDVPRSPVYATLGDELVDAYFERIAALVPAGVPRVARLGLHPTARCRWLDRRASRAARRASQPASWSAEQAQPDPDFPTVAFPNPEEPGAIDLALSKAQEVGR